MAFIFLMALFYVTQNISVVRLPVMQSRLAQKNDTLYVVNFWATWCKPCVEEMPYFEFAQKKFGHGKVKCMFASLNAVKEINSVQRFVVQKNIQNETFVLEAGNPNIWLNQIDSNWSGAIPATVFYKNGKKLYFVEGEIDAVQLDSLISLYK